MQKLLPRLPYYKAAKEGKQTRKASFNTNKMAQTTRSIIFPNVNKPGTYVLYRTFNLALHR